MILHNLHAAFPMCFQYNGATMFTVYISIITCFISAIHSLHNQCIPFLQSQRSIIADVFNAASYFHFSLASSLVKGLKKTLGCLGSRAMLEPGQGKIVSVNFAGALGSFQHHQSWCCAATLGLDLETPSYKGSGQDQKMMLEYLCSTHWLLCCEMP